MKIKNIIFGSKDMWVYLQSVGSNAYVAVIGHVKTSPIQKEHYYDLSVI